MLAIANRAPGPLRDRTGPLNPGPRRSLRRGAAGRHRRRDRGL